MDDAAFSRAAKPGAPIPSSFVIRMRKL
jgi:hypothetical protein